MSREQERPRGACYAPGMTDTATLKKTPFHAWHLENGAKMVPFAGWEMPLHYGSILDEHHQVRRSGGIFDVSHMGRFMITGRDARAFLDMVCTRAVKSMQVGQARYSLVCNDAGGCHDDVLVYKIADGEFMMVCNAANREKLVEHFAAVRGDMVFKFEDFTEKSAMVALQGPKVMDALADVSSEIPGLKRYRFTRKSIMGMELFVSRTGYTGEDGVEVIFRTDSLAAKLGMKMLIGKLGSIDAVKPAGLGSRDSLRLEASMALYGHEIDEQTDPVAANLGFAMKLTKGDEDADEGTFIGQDALRQIKADGPARTLVGLEVDAKRAARQGAEVRVGDTPVGTVTSGCVSPTLEKSIAMAYVDAAHAADGTNVEVAVGSKTLPATVVPMPFYKLGG